METFYPSRRQDLVVGSLVSTLLISTVFLAGGHSQLTHGSFIPPVVPGCTLTPVPPEEVIPVEIEETARVKLQPVAAPALPQLQDLPRPVTPTDMTQVVEPPHPQSNIKDVSVITNLPSGDQAATVWEYDNLDTPPSVRRQSPPHYPSSMIQAGMNGEVIVDFVVDNNGEVRNTTAVRSSNRAFEASAVEAVSKWKFRAGKKGGRFVFTHMQVPIEFNINRE
jgi:protein TonB